MDTPRADVTAELGLTATDVAERVRAGRVNVTPEPPGRSFGQIVAANVFTVVNAIMLTLFVLVLVSGNPKDALFVGVVVSNSVIGVVQEVRARRELQRLEVVTEPRATVLRDGATAEIPSDEIVLDDVVELRLGGQVAVDGDVLEATGLRLDESMLTGESLPVPKVVGDAVMSGSFVVAGNGRIRATAVGADSYASSLATEAKQFAAAQSQLRQGIDRILRWLTVIIPIASIFLFVNLLSAEDNWQDALLGTVAAAVAMVPDGLVLLTSLSFMAGIVALARRNALAKQLSTVEVLARVDVLCLDKTGTITTGEITFAAAHAAEGRTDDEVRDGLVALASSDRDPNASMAAIVAAVGTDTTWEVDRVEPFDSERKWSAASFVDRGWLYLGSARLPARRRRSRPRPRRAVEFRRQAAARGGDVSPTVPTAIVCPTDRGRSRSSNWKTRSAPTLPRSWPTSPSRTSPSRSFPATTRTRWQRSPIERVWPSPAHPSTLASCRATSTSSHRRWTPAPCSVGSNRSRSRRWCARCSPAVTSWR